MNRGMAVVESFVIFKNDEISEQDTEIAIALGWAVEMVKIFLNRLMMCLVLLL